MSVIVLRHTRPQTAEGRCYGRTDLALAEGFEAEVARLLVELPPVARILSSPLSRCFRLAEAIGTARGMPVEVDSGLTEMDFGAWENQPWDAIPRAELDAWRDDFLHARPHGGESVADLGARTAAALDRAAAGEGPVLAVTHAGVIKAALAALGDPAGWHVAIGFAEFRVLEWR